MPVFTLSAGVLYSALLNAAAAAALVLGEPKAAAGFRFAFGP